MSETHIEEQVTRSLTLFQKILMAAVIFVLLGGGAARLFYAHAEVSRVKTELKLDRDAVKSAPDSCDKTTGRRMYVAAPKKSAARHADAVEKLAPGQKININTASEADLQRIPGIGPSYAMRIVELRRQRGSFKAIEELMLVNGIGEGRFAKMKPFVTLESK